MSADLPTVPWADLMDDAEAAYWDAENVHGTDAGIRALTEWAYRKGQAAMPDGTVVTREWMTTWTWPDGHVEEVPAAASVMTRETAEQVARRRAAKPMTGSVGAVLCREVRTGPWVPVAVDAAEATPC